MSYVIYIRRFNSQIVDFLPQIQRLKDFHIAAFAEDPADRLLFRGRGQGYDEGTIALRLNDQFFRFALFI